MAAKRGRHSNSGASGAGTGVSLPPLPAPGPASMGAFRTTPATAAGVTVMGSLIPPQRPGSTPPVGPDLLAEFLHDAERDGVTSETEVLVDAEAELRAERERVLIFGLGNEEYGLEIMEVREILKPPVLTEVPRAPANVLGVFSLRGQVLPVLSLLDVLGVPGDSAGGGADARILVVGRGDETIGLWVHSVAQVVKMATRQLEPPPGGLAANRRAMLRGLGRLDDRLIIVLELPQLMVHLGLTHAPAGVQQ